MKVAAIIQARMNSSRLPGKVMKEIAGRPAIGHTIARASAADGVDELWLACSDDAEDDILADYAGTQSVTIYRGDQDDVLSRFAKIAQLSRPDAIVRLTGDCPMLDPGVITKAISRFRDANVDYVSNSLKRSYPDGLDVEVFSRLVLERADAEANDPFLRQHVTPYIHGRLKERLPWGEFSTDQIVNPVDFSHLRWTLDEPEDLVFLRRLLDRLPDDYHWMAAVAAMTADPDLFWINRKHKLNEGATRDLNAKSGAAAPRRFDRSNQNFARAADVVPLAAQTFSKSHQQWVRGASPLFLTSGNGCRVTDADGNVYIDYLQGLMANVLGYCDPDVDAAIRAQLEHGISFSLATTLEADLAERLVTEIPCAEMVRFGKSGSDATAAAIRLARAVTGRDRVAMCGYHGWHDWSIGTTTRDLGVPRAVRALTDIFPYNDADALERLFRKYPDEFATVILEPAGVHAPEPGFLEALRHLTSASGTVLVFDEIVTGFRVHMGGAQAHFGVVPDLACFGKAMGNGMPIAAVVGRRDLMTGMEDIFFSGTYSGEALSLAAAIATIDKIKRESVVERLWQLGERLTEDSNAIFERHGLGEICRFAGAGWWPRLKIGASDVDPSVLTSLLRQEFVAHGLLLASSFNLCLPHDAEPIVEETMQRLDGAAAKLRDHLDAAEPAARLLGEPVRPTFAVR